MPGNASLSEAVTEFIQGGVSVVAASRGHDNRPVVCRATACRVAPDGQSIAVFMARTACRPLLEAVELTGSVAVVFTAPYSHQSLQLKGEGAKIAPVGADMYESVSTQAEAFAGEVRRLGFSHDFSRTLITYDTSDLVAVVFAPNSAFTQTPGPQAGSPLQE